ncbi:MAG: SDR family oxidoreductase [Saprospiraceae bacterium]|nr:SDR family oxidoreductase [Saprospiraceae bacterium]
MTILITGASRGIGFSTLKSLVALDAQHKIYVLTRNTQALKDKIEADSQLKTATIEVIPFDLTHFTKEDLLHLWTEVDVLINNSGLLINKPFSELTEADWLAMFQTNVLGAAQLTQSLLPLMGQNGKTSHVVNIGSMGGYQGSSKFAGLSAYSASKGALAILSECLAEELKDKNVKCNCLCLGAVDTDMLQMAFPNYKAPTTSDEMGQFIADFALNGHKYFNGKVLPVSIMTP